MRAVIDTNIFLSGLLNAEGGAAKIIPAFQEGEFDLVVTSEVFDEYVRVLHLFDNAIPASQSEDLLELVFKKALKVRPAASRGLCSDADDEKFISAALAGQAIFLVTKNKKHFPRKVSSIKIVTVREFLMEIERTA
ncbi:MAG: putative toxin-antitoxin system toxin component, PIN family [Deltaproteobacteria bacterium]|nr:putative toxin-antitoxin system toxin component, PIN family [Deltaproteobacteria bacterium]